MPFAVPLLRSTCVVVGLLSLVASLRRKDTWFTLSLFATAMYGPFASQPTKNDPAPSTTVNRDTECYATEIEQLEPDGVMTNPYDQAAVFITAVLLFGNVMPRL